jgi:hypothetical protein
LIVGDYFKADNDFVNTVKLAAEVVKWFNNHPFARGMLQEEQIKMKMPILALILACLTRWTSHYLSVRRLLALKQPLRSVALIRGDELVNTAGSKKHQRDAAEEIIRVIDNQSFWSKLEQ